MKTNVYLSALPSVQEFLTIGPCGDNDALIAYYCRDFKEVFTSLAILRNEANDNEEMLQCIDRIQSFSAYLYKDLVTMRQESLDYIAQEEKKLNHNK